MHGGKKFMTAITLPVVPADDSLSKYFNAVWKFPILEREEEQLLAISLRDHGDVNAAHKLVTSHLRLVCKIAMGFRGYGLPIADLISEGNIGLMKAVKKFDPDQGFRLSTYAIWWIRASITEYILKSWSMVKMGTIASQKKLFFSLRKMKSRLGILDNGDLKPEEAQKLAEFSGATESEVTHMNQRLSWRDMSLSALVRNDGKSFDTFQDILEDTGLSPESQCAEKEELAVQHSILTKAVSALPEREREIFYQRRLSEDPPTLEELGGRYGISRERVRQLEARAFKRVQEAVIAAQN